MSSIESVELWAVNHLELRLVLHPTSSTDYLLTEAWVDGIPLVDYSIYAVNLAELLASADSDGDYWIVTCWCGDPGCAGIQKAVMVMRTTDAVHWHLREPGPARHLVFPQAAYRAVVQDAQEACREWMPEREYGGGKLLAITPVQNEIFFPGRAG